MWGSDKYRDDTEGELVGRVAFSAFSNIVDSIMDTHTAIKVLAITVTAEIGGLTMLFFAKEKVRLSLAESESDVWIYAGAVVFAVGFLTIFALYRLIAKKWPHVGASIFIWLVSIGAGVLNILLFFALVTLESR